jgi:membrane-associated protease RseP (regulator of RpoE activity)
MVDGVLVALALLNVYIVALFLLHRRGQLRGPTLELVGPLLLWRTEHGKDLIERVAKPARFWKAFGDAGVAITLVAGAAMMALILWNVTILLTRRDILLSAQTSPEYLLVLPGINPLIPLWYGILSLAVALIVHEGAHGVLARAHQIKVKSLGLLLLIVPIGAFVEPDDEELERAPTRTKNRVFAAGIMTNLVVAFLCAAAFSAAWSGVHIAQDGLGVSSVVEGQGAAQAGLQPGMIITSLDGRAVTTAAAFNETLGAKRAGDTLEVGLWQQGQTFTRTVTLSDKYAYYAQADPTLNNETFRGRAFMGITTFPMSFATFVRDVSADPLVAGTSSLGLFLLFPFPIVGGASLSPLPPAFEPLFTISGPLAALPAPAFWVLVNSLYWVFWLNLMVGTFNALPLNFLDGGQMFRASVKGILRRRFGVARDKLVVERPLGGRMVLVRGADAATQTKLDRIDALTRTITLAVGLGILMLILVPILGPYIARAL